MEEEGGENENETNATNSKHDKLTTSKLARVLGLKTQALTDRLTAEGLLEPDGEKLKLTEVGKSAGGEFKFSPRFGPYFLWPKDMKI